MQLVESAGWVPTSARSLPSFKLIRPASVEQTLQALREADQPVLLAGGTDLVAAFNEGLAPNELITLARVEALRGITLDGRSLRIGAGITHGAGSSDPLLRERMPGFAQAWSRIANPRIRFSATIGGNLMARRARYEASLLLSAADARLEFATAQHGELRLAPPALWAGAVPERALLTAIHIDTGDLLHYDYERSMRPLLTLAFALRRRGDGVQLRVAVATEYLQPMLLELTLANTAAIPHNARAIAGDAFSQLPAAFADPVVSHAYARAAGAALLARRLESLPHV